jgi:hypothetical protein
MKHLYVIIFLLGFLSVSNAQIINFPDANFKNKLLEASADNETAKDLSGASVKIDANDNNEIELSEALNVSSLQLSDSQIASLEGITSFVNLKYLYCWYNVLGNVNLTGLSNLINIECFQSHVTGLNLTGLSHLETLTCYGNEIQTLTIQGLPRIKSINCSENQLTSLDASNLSTLITLSCGGNQITNLNLDNLTSLKNLYCNHNDLTSIDVSDLILLDVLYCNFNQLTSLDLSNSHRLDEVDCGNNALSSLNLDGAVTLKTLYCFGNQLTVLDTSDLKLRDFRCSNNQLQVIDITNMPNITVLDCNYNDLRYLLLKNGSSNYALDFLGNPNLAYACIDENLVFWIQNRVNAYGYTNCHINSYCSFTPGGTYYTVQGNSAIDLNNNGCQSNNPVFPGLRLSVAQNLNSINFISNASGNYAIPVQAGTQTITPVLENPSYYTISPTSFSVTFPAQSSPVTQNFCITPNGSHQDVETWIIPSTPARPGFDSRYKIMYKNKGNTTVSGSLVFAFDDDNMDFISAIPIQNNQSLSLLNWNYSNLLPFETREIEVKFNINSPMETPAVNNGDLLKFSSTIFPIIGDQYSSDNSNGLNQIVVGSLDPNDKTCVEGNFVEPEMIGQYVHYVIRFENTGTFAAENIVVKDSIDETKFDIATLVPLDASDEFTTRIAGSKVEFIFENINLPFDDENNDGYVAFKIKTKSTLAIGTTFSNTASIYFDYNFPIVTNTASTTIQVLSNQDFEFSNYFALYPNPVKDILHIQSKSVLSIHSVSIYNLLGQVLQVVTNPTEEINVADLKTGNYLIKVITDKGTSAGKFVKC